MNEFLHKTNDNIVPSDCTEQLEQHTDMQQGLSASEQSNHEIDSVTAEAMTNEKSQPIENGLELQVGGNVPQTDAKADINAVFNVESATQKHSDVSKRKPKALSYLLKLAILSAIGVVLLAIEFPLFPATPWLELNISDFPTLIASFMFGPLSGAIVNAVKIAISLFLWQTNTGFVGEMSNLISGTLYALVAGSIYILHRNKKGAIVALAISSGVFCLTMTLCNRYFLLPMYGMDAEPAVYGIIAWTVLFNVIKTVLTSVITFYVYKRTRQLFARF